jgi:hypothetical protein
MNPGDMNSKIINIWDNEIGSHLVAGDINIEMDIQTIFRSKLEKQKLIAPSNPTWRCYHDLMLLKVPNRLRYDMVLLKYENKDKPENHFPAIVVEFKLWNSKTNVFDNDLDKLKMLFGEKYPHAPTNNQGYCKKPYAYHLMYILDLRDNQIKLDWDKNLKKFKKNPRFEVNEKDWLSEEANKIIMGKTKLSQWGRYQGNKKKDIDWLNKKNRTLRQLRVSWKNKIDGKKKT